MRVEQAGVDTWSPCWYVREGDAVARAMAELANVPAPRSRLIEESILGHRVGWFPGTGLVFAEGHPGGDRLGSADALPEVLWRLEEALHDYGLPVGLARTHSRWGGSCRPQGATRLPGFAGVRRLDVTADLRFERGPEGLAVLAGVAALGGARAKSDVVFERGAGSPVETVYLRSQAGRVLGRWYDKGIEAGTAPRGRLIRPEDQRRFTRASRPGVEAVTSSFVRDRFRSRFLPLWQAAKGVTVGGPDALAMKIAELLEAEQITPAMAERLAGFALLQRHGVEVGSRATQFRRRGGLRRHGLVLADGVLQDVEVDLHDVLEELLDADVWQG